jgi:Ribosomal protein L11 methyltransferase (PrmA)
LLQNQQGLCQLRSSFKASFVLGFRNMRLLQLQAATALLLLAAIAVSRAFVVIPTRVRTSVPARVRTGSPLHNSIDLNSGQAATAPQLQWWDESTQLKELKIPCNELNGNALEPSALTQFLMEVGAVSASAVDAAKDTASETPLFHEHDGTLELDVTWGTLTSDKYKYWSNTTVTAHFPQEWDLRGTIDMIEEVFECASPLSFTVDDVVSKDWVKTVQASWQPCNIGSLRIRFPWHEPLAPEELKAAGQVGTKHLPNTTKYSAQLHYMSQQELPKWRVSFEVAVLQLRCSSL